ncbi:MAG: hypothetical protein PF542_04035 [Nanoarchaeota archaeon]|jgi:hypothetical protein|nr:hypothetical protein [Nanoarchaeota archaeon]
MKRVIAFVFILCLIFPLVSAGVSVKWGQESILVPEKTKDCLTYEVYNPFPEDAYNQVKVSEELTEFLVSSEAEVKFIPKNTPSTESLSIEFCFKTPKVYEEDCLIGNSLLCKQECGVDMVQYSGEVEVIELTETEASEASGSETRMSVSAPLNVKVQCVPHKTNYSAVYVLIALIAGILLVVNIVNSKKGAKKSKKKTSSRKLKKSK